MNIITKVMNRTNSCYMQHICGSTLPPPPLYTLAIGGTYVSTYLKYHIFKLIHVFRLYKCIFTNHHILLA